MNQKETDVSTHLVSSFVGVAAGLCAIAALVWGVGRGFLMRVPLVPDPAQVGDWARDLVSASSTQELALGASVAAMGIVVAVTVLPGLAIWRHKRLFAFLSRQSSAFPDRGESFGRDVAVVCQVAVSVSVLVLFGDPLGDWYEVVGVVEEPRAAAMGAQSSRRPSLYLSVLQVPPARSTLLVRPSSSAEVDPEDIASFIHGLPLIRSAYTIEA